MNNDKYTKVSLGSNSMKGFDFQGLVYTDKKSQKRFYLPADEQLSEIGRAHV
jgi:hypothetical protein